MCISPFSTYSCIKAKLAFKLTCWRLGSTDSMGNKLSRSCSFLPWKWYYIYISDKWQMAWICNMLSTFSFTLTTTFEYVFICLINMTKKCNCHKQHINFEKSLVKNVLSNSWHKILFAHTGDCLQATYQ
jgi:hypothetical protein